MIGNGGVADQCPGGVDPPVCSIRVISNRVMSISWEVRLKDFHAIDQIGAACNEHRIVVRRCLLDGFFHRGSADIKVFMPKLLLHALTSLLLARVALAQLLCWTAATNPVSTTTTKITAQPLFNFSLRRFVSWEDYEIL